MLYNRIVKKEQTMKILKFTTLALILGLFLLLVFSLPTTVQGIAIKDTYRMSPDSSVVSVTNPDQSHQTSTRQIVSSQITFTPVVTIYLPIVTNCWGYERECENPSTYTVGQMIFRSNASNNRVHGQFGATPNGAARSGYAKYGSINIPELDHLYLMLRYSKYSASEVPVEVYLDDETTPRATLFLENQESWNKFSWKILGPTDVIDLGSVISDTHSIKFYTDGQKNGVADLDKFVLNSCP
jgi:hypothetical protein